MSDPFDQTTGERLRAMAREYGWRLLVLFGSLARDRHGRDVDLAVMAGGPVGLFTHGGWQAEVESLFSPTPVDLVLVEDASSPVLRFEVFRDGLCLYEAEPGLFSREQDRAFFLYADSEVFRRQQREALRRKR